MSTQKNGLDPYIKLFTDKEVIKEMEGYEETFRVRTYYEKYRNLARLSAKSSYLFNALSVAAGVLGLASVLAMFLLPNLWLMCIPAFLLLSLSEYGKRVLLRNWIIEKLRDRKTNSKLVTANALLIALSMTATVYGGVELVKMARNRTKPTLTSIKSIETKYNAEIAKIEALQSDITKRNTYKGQTWLPADERALNAKYDADIRVLRADQKTAITQAKTSNKSKMANYQEGTKGYIVGFILLSLVIEGLCILTIYFPLQFKYKAKEDRNLVINQATKVQPSVLLGLMNQLGVDFKALANNMQTTTLQFASAPTPSPMASSQPVTKPKAKNPNAKPIGFTSDTSKNTHPPKEHTAKPRRERGTTKNYELINRLLLEGGRTTHQIAMAANCSDTTVRNAKKKLKEAGLLNEEN